jgi:hypothetical protein
VKPLLFSILIVLVATVGFIACKQGKGDRCQVDDDCTPPLVCNRGSLVCSSTTGGGIDAVVPDAPADSNVIFVDAN